MLRQLAQNVDEQLLGGRGCTIANRNAQPVGQGRMIGAGLEIKIRLRPKARQEGCAVYTGQECVQLIQV